MKNKSFYSMASLVLLLVLFAAASMLSTGLLRGWRLDLTENKLYNHGPG